MGNVLVILSTPQRLSTDLKLFDVISERYVFLPHAGHMGSWFATEFVRLNSQSAQSVFLRMHLWTTSSMMPLIAGFSTWPLSTASMSCTIPLLSTSFICLLFKVCIHISSCALCVCVPQSWSTPCLRDWCLCQNKIAYQPGVEDTPVHK